jgi:hypothetical protein
VGLRITDYERLPFISDLYSFPVILKQPNFMVIIFVVMNIIITVIII